MAGSENSWTTEARDIAIEAAVIQHLLHLHPSQPTAGELLRELGGDRPDFAERDAIERAVRDLVAIGLLHRRDELLMPTRAALRLSELLER
jgi:hypothetical protein